jgi:hypothetical protein
MHYPVGSSPTIPTKQRETMKHNSVVGIITQVSGSNEFWLETEEETYYALKFAGVVEKDILNVKVALCISTVSVDGYHVVCTHDDFCRILKQ